MHPVPDNRSPIWATTIFQTPYVQIHMVYGQTFHLKLMQINIIDL